MKNSRHNTTYFAIICLVLLIGIFSYLIFSLNKQYKVEETLTSKLDSIKIEERNSSMAVALLLGNLSMTYNYDNLVLPNFTVEDMKGNKFDIKELFQKSQYKLVFFFSYLHCETCISSALTEIESMSNDIKSENLIIIGEFANKRAMQAYLANHSLKLPIYFKKDSVKLGILDDENMPFLCMMRKDLKINHILIPIKEVPNQLMTYLKIMKDRYFINYDMQKGKVINDPRDESRS